MLTSRNVVGSGARLILPRTSPPANWLVWKLIYERPPRIFDTWAVNVVLLPSGASHFPLIVPPTPVEKGFTTTSLGLLSLNGVPKNPQATGPFVVRVTLGPA